MPKTILKHLWLAIFLFSCASTSKNQHKDGGANSTEQVSIDQPSLATDMKPASMMDLARSQDGAFILAPGFYEAEFKSYCLQPGTPDPGARDAYLQAPIQGYRKEIVETILLNSRARPHLEQKNVQLLLWSTVSGSDYNKLPWDVQNTAAQLLTSKQIFELKGGVMGVVKTVYSSGVMQGSGDINRLFQLGYSSYDAFERAAVIRKSSTIHRPDYKIDQWYKQEGSYYVRHFPSGYQKVKIQVYVPDGIIDSTGKSNGEWMVFDPTGLQSVPANSNAQRLGIGGPLLDIVKVIIQVERNRDRSKPQKQAPPKPIKPIKGVS